MEGVGGGAGAGLEGGGRAEMVRVGMTEQDRRAALGSGKNVLEVTVIIRAGIENNKAANSLDEVGVGAVIGHQAWVVGDNPGDARHDRQRYPAFGI